MEYAEHYDPYVGYYEITKLANVGSPLPLLLYIRDIAIVRPEEIECFNLPCRRTIKMHVWVLSRFSLVANMISWKPPLVRGSGITHGFRDRSANGFPAELDVGN